MNSKLLLKDISAKLLADKQFAVINDGSDYLIEINGIHNGYIIVDNGPHRGEYFLSDSLIKPLRKPMVELLNNNPNTGKRYIVELAEMTTKSNYEIETFKVTAEYDCVVSVEVTKFTKDLEIHYSFSVYYDLLGFINSSLKIKQTYTNIIKIG